MTTSSSLPRLRPKPSSPERGHADPPAGTQPAIFPEHHLRKGSVDVHADHTSHFLLLSFDVGGSSGQHDNYGSALAAQPGRSQGRPATNASSRLMMYIGLPTLRAPGAPRPGWSHHTPGTSDPSRTSRHRDLHTGYQCYRGAQFQAAPGGQGQRPLSQRRSGDEVALPGLEPRREGVDHAAARVVLWPRPSSPFSSASALHEPWRNQLSRPAAHEIPDSPGSPCPRLPRDGIHCHGPRNARRARALGERINSASAGSLPDSCPVLAPKSQLRRHPAPATGRVCLAL